MRAACAYFSVVVDKTSIERDGGHEFKTSFIKNIGGLLYSQLYADYPSLHIFADAHGTVEFQESLRDYVGRRSMPDLFDHQDFSSVDSASSILIQVSDFFAGTIRIVSESPHLEHCPKYRALLTTKSIGGVSWPPKHWLRPPPTSPSTFADEQVFYYARQKAELFISKHEASHGDDVRIQIHALNYLLFRCLFAQSKEYVTTQELIDHLEVRGFKGLKEQALRSNVIAKLRDADVIIASSSKGYKIPTTKADMSEFVDRVANQVVPLLDRLKRAQQSYLRASHKSYDILSTKEGRELSKLLLALESLALGSYDT